jgi:hypothetical protein
VPINQVARVLKMNVGGEEVAARIDAMLKKDIPDQLTSVPGFVKISKDPPRSPHPPRFRFRFLFSYQSPNLSLL